MVSHQSEQLFFGSYFLNKKKKRQETIESQKVFIQLSNRSKIFFAHFGRQNSWRMRSTCCVYKMSLSVSLVYRWSACVSNGCSVYEWVCVCWCGHDSITIPHIWQVNAEKKRRSSRRTHILFVYWKSTRGCVRGHIPKHTNEKK